MYLEGVPSEVNQRKTNTVRYHLQWNLKIKQTNEHNKTETDADVEDNLLVTNGERDGEGARRRGEIKRYKLPCIK